MTTTLGGSPGTRPDWRTMTRDAFDVSAPDVQLVLDDNIMPVTDGCGTGDLFTLLDGSST